jgi:IS30 family transposase
MKPSTNASTPISAPGGPLHRALRCQKLRKKRYSGRDRCGTIPNQVSIDRRPAIVGSRKRFSDGEADLIIGAGQKQALVTMNERTSRYSQFAHVPFKTAQAVSDNMISMLTSFSACVLTLTTGNGREFAQHERIAKELGADFFFAHPYSSWERGANENMNGLIREFFPKKMRFDLITKKEIFIAMHYLNHRPRKCLGFKTPHEVFWNKLHSCHNAVALQT